MSPRAEITAYPLLQKGGETAVQLPAPLLPASALPAGLFRGPDRCCREHDRCEAQIAALEFNYGIRNYRLHTVSDCDGRCARPAAPRPPMAPRPTTRYLTAPWQLEPGPSTAVTMLEQGSAGGRQMLGEAQQGGRHSTACVSHHEEDSIRSSPAAELGRATPVPPLDQHRQRGESRLDKCEHQIAPHEVKYELHNIDTRTLFHCNCTRRSVSLAYPPPKCARTG
uniref:Phospholipase A2-like central domain-containing protein n=1 Tax=Dromaius novaehollandiae TaxID=8790 RepID=A0A8C4P627_DRONO